MWVKSPGRPHLQSLLKKTTIGGWLFSSYFGEDSHVSCQPSRFGRVIPQRISQFIRCCTSGFQFGQSVFKGHWQSGGSAGTGKLSEWWSLLALLVLRTSGDFWQFLALLKSLLGIIMLFSLGLLKQIQGF